jgi:hypothetical protein
LQGSQTASPIIYRFNFDPTYFRKLLPIITCKKWPNTISIFTICHHRKKSVLMYVKYLSQIGFSGAMTIAVWQGIYFYYQGNLQIPQKLFNSNPT